MTQFLLHNQLVSLANEECALTVLEYLRLRVGKCGTKEGCASGDCGACTVVLASPNDDDDGETLRYEAINSCIAFAGTLHGKQLITVDDLADGKALHPVQQAMVTHHASQCGFCTPGFVMSLFSLWKNFLSGEAIDSSVALDTPDPGWQVDEYLGGNLCRCTGYKPIITAALEVMRTPKPDHFSHDEAAVLAALKNIARAVPPVAPAKSAQGKSAQENQRASSIAENAGGNVKGNVHALSCTQTATPTVFHHPTSLAQLATLVQQHADARLLAGGTDLALEVTQQCKDLPVIIYLGAVQALQQIKEEKTAWRIGTAVNLVRCQELLSGYYPELSSLLARFGSRQIRLRGTLGGNVANASPIGDMPPVLIALNATLTLQQGQATRNLPVENFFLAYKKTALQPGEFVRDVVVPKPAVGHQLKIYKISKRLDDDISAVCAVFYIRLSTPEPSPHESIGIIQNIRVAFGGMAATPKRALACEKAMHGQPLNMQTIAGAQQALATDFQPITDMRASATYRMHVACNLLEKMYIELSDNTVQTRCY